MAAIQTDCVSLQAAGLVGALVGPTAASLTRPAARRAAGLLLAWDCAMRADAPAPVVFHLFYQALLARVVRPVCEARAPGLYQRYLSLLQLAVPAIDSLLLRADGAWFPHGVGETVEACLAEAWAEAERRLGTDPARWRWGALHTLTLHHGMGRGRQPLLRALVALFRLDRGPYPRPGDGMTVNLAAFPLVEPFGVVAGPSYRQIVDLGAPEESRWVLGGGVSGDPRSPHYADQIPAWLRGEYRPMRFLDAASSAKRDINETRSGAG
jgi:penicillin amidase